MTTPSPSDQLTLGVAVRGTLRESLEWYLNRCMDGRSPASIRKRREETEYLCAWFGGGMLVADIDYERLCNYVRRNKDRGLAITTTITRLNSLHVAMKEAIRRGLIQALPAWPRLIDTRPARRKRAPSLAEYEAVRPFVPPHRLAYFDAAWWTGMRKADLAGTRRHHVDMKQREWLRRSTKTHAHPEIFPMPPRWFALLVLEFELRPVAEQARICGTWTNASRDIGRACEAAGVLTFGLNDMRRGCEMRLVAEGHPLPVVRLWICHTEAVARRYYETMTDDLRAAARARMR